MVIMSWCALYLWLLLPLWHIGIVKRKRMRWLWPRRLGVAVPAFCEDCFGADGLECRGCCGGCAACVVVV